MDSLGRGDVNVPAVLGHQSPERLDHGVNANHVLDHGCQLFLVHVQIVHVLVQGQRGIERQVCRKEPLKVVPLYKNFSSRTRRRSQTEEAVPVIKRELAGSQLRCRTTGISCHPYFS